MLRRRNFLALAAAGALPLRAAFAYPLAFQLFSVRVAAAKDFAGTLRRVKGFGYREVELVSFHGYSGTDTRNGFGPLAPLATAEIRRIIAGEGLTVQASHFKLDEFANASAIEWASGLGLKHMVISDVPAAETLDDWKRIFARMSAHAADVRKAGMKLGYHTSFESFRNINGAVVIEELLKAIPAELVDVQLDLSTTLSRAADPVAFLDRFGKRVFSLHLRDGVKPAQPGAYVFSLPLGKGEMNWPAILTAARRAGVANYVVEMAMQPAEDPFEALRDSAEFLSRA